MPSTFEWRAISDNPNVVGESLSSKFTNTVNDLLVNNSNVDQEVRYTVTPRGIASLCEGDAFEVAVTVKPVPLLTVNNTKPVICAGAPVNISLSTPVAGSVITLTSVTYNGVTGTLSNNTNYSSGSVISETLSHSFNTARVVTYEFTITANGCPNSTIYSTSVTVNPLPSAQAVPASETICSNTPTNITLSNPNSVGGTNYSWIVLTSTNVNGATSGSGSSIVQTLSSANGTSSGTLIYRVTPAAAGCDGASIDVPVTVNHLPTANGSDVTICSGSSTSITINANPINIPGTTFQWSVLPSSNVNGASSGNGSLISQALSLSNSSVGNVIYRITPTANGCDGPTKDIVATVNPLPTVNAGSDYEVCEPGTVTINGTIGGAATSGTWIKVSGNGVLSSSTTSGGNVVATYTVVSSDVGSSVVFRLETNDPDGSGPCTLASDLLEVRINRKATVSVPADYVICEPSNLVSSPIALSGTLGGSASSGLWSVVSGNGVLSASNVSGSTVTAGYVLATPDVSNFVTLRLTTNDPDASGPCTSESDEINIQINQRAIVSAGPDLAICRNTPSVALQGSFGGSTTVVTWTGGTGLYTNVNSATSSYTFNDPSEVNTTFSLTLTASDPDASGPCTSVSDNMNLTVNPLPTVVFFGLPANGTPPQVAENSPPFKLFGNQVGGNFTITPGAGLSGTTPNPLDEVVVSPSIATIYDGSVGTINQITYAYTDSKGCHNSSTQSLIVNAVTSVDFAVQGATLDGAGNFEICAQQGRVKLVGFPDPSNGLPPETEFISTTSGLVIEKIGADFFIQTNNVTSGTYDIRYTFKNQQNAISFRVRAVKILASPVASLGVGSSCIQAPIAFSDLSTIPTTPFPTAITSWQWSFGEDNASSTQQNPTYAYEVAGNKTVTLRVTTGQNCTTSTSQVIRVGNIPDVAFSWSAICNNESTKYEDKTESSFSTITQYSWNFGDGFSISGSSTGDIPTGSNGGRTTGTYKQPNHKYDNFGDYTSRLSVTTNDGCTNFLEQRVFILPYSTVTPAVNASYFEGFEASDGGWIEEGLINSDGALSNISWLWGTPTGEKINVASAGSKVWWTGANSNSYYPKENSVLNGPCFNLSQLKRPMVSIDYWNDSEKDVDGAVLQYSIDGGLSWRIVGPPEGQANRNEGIDWFNSTAITSNPGDQIIGPYGWTDRSTADWKTGRFNLDMIPSTGRGQVRLRIAFASNDANPGKFDGFAFDNFFVGEKEKKVLLEHFTNTNSISSSAGDLYLDGLLTDQFVYRSVSDFTDVRYHISLPTPDALNLDNQADPAARALVFGVSQPPITIMDGILNSQFKGNFADITRVEIDRQALRTPQFEIKLDTVPTGVANRLKVNLTLTAKQAINNSLRAQVLLLEDEVATSKNVVRKALFGSDGQTLTNAFVAGQSTTLTNSTDEIDVPISNPQRLTLVAFVQDKSSKHIYQSATMPAPFKRGAIIVGLEDETTTTLNGINIYPNPASKKFNFGIYSGTKADGFTWKVADQRGVIVRSGDFTNMLNGQQEVDISRLADGVYFVIITGPGKSVIYKKLVILNQY